MNPLAAARSRLRIRGHFFGWYVVAAAASISFYSAGIYFYGFGVFFKPILTEFGWSRAATAGAVSFSRVEGGLEAPVIGWLIDRLGPRKLALIGATLLGLGYLVLSQISSLWMFYLIYVGVLAVGYNTGVMGTGTAAVANWFVKKRSRAFAIYALGAGLGGSIIVPLLGVLISRYGWRTTLILAGLGVWLFMLPMALLLRQRPEKYGLHPDGAATAAREEEESGEGEADFTPAQALRTRAFWLITVSTGFRSLAMTAVVLHQVAHFIDVGIPEVAAATALGLMALFSLPARFFFGWLGDVMEKRYVMVMAFLLQAVGVFILANVHSMAMVYLFVVVYGMGYGGAIPVQFALRADYFGRKSYATISGLAQFFLMVPTVVGPVFAGWVYDTTGSYYWAFMLFTVAFLVGAVFMFFAKRPRPPGTRGREVRPSSPQVSH